MSPLPLTTADLENLNSSFIDPNLAKKAGLYRVSSIEGARLMSRNGGRDYSGVIYPYLLPENSTVRMLRLRRDRPDVERKSDGSYKQTGKYLTRKGQGNLIYFAPDTKSAWLTDISLPVAITEGEKKTLSLHRLSWHGGEGNSPCPNFLPLGLSGIWNWRGKFGEEKDAQGRTRVLKGPIPDLELLTWQDRTVFIVFDSNAITNTNVYRARRALTDELIARGAHVRHVELPQCDGINGVDDLLASKGPEFVLKLFSAANESEFEAKSSSRKSLITSLLEELELFHTVEGSTFATVTVDDHSETWELKSKGFRDWLSKRNFEFAGKVPNAHSLNDTLGVLDGTARFGRVERDVHTRVALHEDCIWIDLGDPDWRQVRIGQNGWDVVPAKRVKFRRPAGMKSLPDPCRDGTIEELRKFVNVTDAEWPLLLGWLLAALRPGFPFPVLAVQGEQGTAKSTVSRIIRSLIDPNLAALRSQPRDDRELIIAASNSWVVGMDNLSTIPNWFSDALCRLSTGGGFASRKLYSDDEEVIFEVKRPIILNGVVDLATRSDLLDRAIILRLPPIDPAHRHAENDLWAEFEQRRPAILGALFTAASHALRTFKSVHLAQPPRMADFAIWATAGEAALGLEDGALMRAYRENRASSSGLAIEASAIGNVIITFVRQVRNWKGTASKLLNELTEFCNGEKKPGGWPNHANKLSGELNRIASDLRMAGVEIQRGRTANDRSISLTWIGALSTQSSSSSARGKTSVLLCDSNDDAGDGTASVERGSKVIGNSMV